MIYKCRACNQQLQRANRTPLEWLRFAAVYRCSRCGADVTIYRRYLNPVVSSYRFLASRYTKCVRCASESVIRVGYSYPMAKNPLGWIQRPVGAPLYECNDCRHGYYDWRPMRPERSPRADDGGLKSAAAG